MRTLNRATISPSLIPGSKMVLDVKIGVWPALKWGVAIEEARFGPSKFAHLLERLTRVARHRSWLAATYRVVWSTSHPGDQAHWLQHVHDCPSIGLLYFDLSSSSVASIRANLAPLTFVPPPWPPYLFPAGNRASHVWTDICTVGVV